MAKVRVVSSVWVNQAECHSRVLWKLMLRWSLGSKRLIKEQGLWREWGKQSWAKEAKLQCQHPAKLSMPAGRLWILPVSASHRTTVSTLPQMWLPPEDCDPSQANSGAEANPEELTADCMPHSWAAPALTKGSSVLHLCSYHKSLLKTVSFLKD